MFALRNKCFVWNTDDINVIRSAKFLDDLSQNG